MPFAWAVILTIDSQGNARTDAQMLPPLLEELFPGFLFEQLLQITNISIQTIQKNQAFCISDTMDWERGGNGVEEETFDLQLQHATFPGLIPFSLHSRCRSPMFPQIQFNQSIWDS